MTQDRLRVLFCDHLNLARGKFLPPSKIGDGATRVCQSTFGVTYDKDLIPAPGSKVLENLPDIEIRYRGEDIRADWLPNTRVVVGDLWEEGSPFDACGRHALKRAIKDWQDLGFEPMVGLELEAFAFQQNPDGTLVPYDTPKAYVYSTGAFADPRGFTQAIWERATARGFNIDSMTSEFDTPQFEFTLTYDKALKAVDDNFLFRQLARDKDPVPLQLVRNVDGGEEGDGHGAERPIAKRFGGAADGVEVPREGGSGDGDRDELRLRSPWQQGCGSHRQADEEQGRGRIVVAEHTGSGRRKAGNGHDHQCDRDTELTRHGAAERDQRGGDEKRNDPEHACLLL